VQGFRPQRGDLPGNFGVREYPDYVQRRLPMNEIRTRYPFTRDSRIFRQQKTSSRILLEPVIVRMSRIWNFEFFYFTLTECFPLQCAITAWRTGKTRPSESPGTESAVEMRVENRTDNVISGADDHAFQGQLTGDEPFDPLSGNNKPVGMHGLVSWLLHALVEHRLRAGISSVYHKVCSEATRRITYRSANGLL
jgi:hypothetical protein